MCNNSSLDRIRAMMPLCDSHGIAPTWQEPADDVVRAFFDDLVEVPVRADEQKSLTRDTTDDEMQRIATRLEEVAAAAAVGEFGFTVEEAEAAEAASLVEREEFVGEEDLTGPEAEPSEPGEGELVGPEPSDSLPQAEPPAPPRRRLRKAADVAGRQTGQQPSCRATRSTAASTVAAGAPHAAAATGAGSSRSTATAPAKRAREPPPPPRRTGGEPDFDLSVLSSDEEEEE